MNFINFVRKHAEVLTWLALYLLFILASCRHLTLLSAVVVSTNNTLPMVLLWCMLHEVLLPRLLHRSRGWFFLATILTVMILVLIFSQWDIVLFRYLAEHYKEEFPILEVSDGMGVILLHTKYIFLLLTTATVTSVSYLIDMQRKDELAFREEQMRNQLKYLRSQINPHFLFNSLNCIYALAMTQDERTPDSVLKLSEMLRYVIDDCSANTVLLQKEIHYINNYIDFQRIRMDHEPQLSFDCHITDPGYTIPPMILQPMIENCFKHSRIVDNPKAWIKITLLQDATGLLFTAENSKHVGSVLSTKDDERTGIGLLNVKQRLEMLFGNQCSFKVLDDPERYKTILHIS